MTHDRQRDLANATALGNALLAFLVVPWTFTLLLYTSEPPPSLMALPVARACTQHTAGSTANGGPCLHFTYTLTCRAGLHWSYPADKAAALRVARSALRCLCGGLVAGRRWLGLLT